jgi:hypothetical protein
MNNANRSDPKEMYNQKKIYYIEEDVMNGKRPKLDNIPGNRAALIQR